MSKDRFQVAYDGPIVREGSMDVYDLAPALLSLGDLVRDVNRILNQDRASVSLQVQSDFEHGSFEVSLVIDQNLIETARAILFVGAVVDAQGLTKIIFGDSTTGKVISGVLKLYKLLNGKKPDPSKITIEHADNSSITIIENLHVDSNTANLYLNDTVRYGVDKIARPIAKPGIDKLEVRKDNKTVEELAKTDLPERVPESGQETDESSESLSNTRDALLTVVTANFEKGKWKFSDGTATFSADVDDESFRVKLNAREIGFYKGDSLRVRLRITQKLKPDGKLQTRYSIQEVIEYRSAPKQPPLLGK